MAKKVLFILLAVILSAAIGFAQEETTAAPEAAIVVEELVLCTGVEERQPVEANTEFTNDVGRVYCFSKIVGVTEATPVFHVFYHNDVQMAKIELTVKGTPWRTWSYKTILENWLGDWKVEVQDADGNVLKSAPFKINKPAM